MSITYLRDTPCKKCGNHRFYRKSGKCVICAAALRQSAKILNFDPSNALDDPRIAMAGVVYENESGFLA